MMNTELIFKITSIALAALVIVLSIALIVVAGKLKVAYKSIDSHFNNYLEIFNERNKLYQSSAEAHFNAVKEYTELKNERDTLQQQLDILQKKVGIGSNEVKYEAKKELIGLMKDISVTNLINQYCKDNEQYQSNYLTPSEMRANLERIKQL